MGRNLGFGPALNRAIAELPDDPVIVLNSDLDCDPELTATLLVRAESTGAEMGRSRRGLGYPAAK